MTTKLKVYIGLLPVALLLIGGGLWMMYGSAGKAANLQGALVTYEGKLSIPEDTPIIYRKMSHIMRGESNYLYIYPDGSVIYIEEKGLRMQIPDSPNPPTRTWKTGKLTDEQLDNLLGYLKSSGLDKLDERYQFPGKPMEPIKGAPAGGFTMGDMEFTVIINYENLNKKVTAFGYLTSDKGETYSDMPSPLNDIYVRLRTIALGTQEVARENID